MSEDYRIVQLRAEPLPAGGVGLCVRLSGCPSRRWSLDVIARLGNEMAGHAAVGRLRLNEIVHGDQIVLEGVEASEAPALAGAFRRAVDAANCAGGQNSSANVAQEEADAIADQIALEPAGERDQVTPCGWFG
jgi:hypothetical protein